MTVTTLLTMSKHTTETAATLANPVGCTYIHTHINYVHYKIEGFALTYFVSYKWKDRHKWSVGVCLLDGDRASTCEAIQSVK